MPAHVVRYQVVVWVICLSVASWLSGESAPNDALLTMLYASVCVLGAVWGCLVARRGQSRAALFALPVGAALLATVLTTIAIYAEPDSGLDSFYPGFLIPVYAIVLGVPIWVGSSIGAVWRLAANRRHRNTSGRRAHPARD